MATSIFIDCEKCEESKDCVEKPRFQREALFSYTRDEIKSCSGYSPRRYRGLEGVMA